MASGHAGDGAAIAPALALLLIFAGLLWQRHCRPAEFPPQKTPTVATAGAPARPRQPVVQPVHPSAARRAGAGAVAPISVYVRAVDAIWRQESSRGRDPASRPGHIGAAGERGEFQVTPIWAADAERLTGLAVDPHNRDRCRYHVLAWLVHYGPRVGAETVDDLCDLYRLGPTGYRRARGIGPRTAHHPSTTAYPGGRLHRGARPFRP